ncbi:MAG: GyrI-like domain-containing protein [Micromonosporaceae bacterium]|nr:GyrI-like domain-containing protein [Micromonosporaceae bacterium]
MSREGHDQSRKGQIPRLRAWAEPRGLLSAAGLRVFGFDNCQPAPNHRYTCMIPVAGDLREEGDITIVDLPAGLYAVTTVRGADNIHPTWERLSVWASASNHRVADRQALEEIMGPVDGQPEDLTLQLYLPVEE